MGQEVTVSSSMQTGTTNLGVHTGKSQDTTRMPTASRYLLTLLVLLTCSGITAVAETFDRAAAQAHIDSLEADLRQWRAGLAARSDWACMIYEQEIRMHDPTAIVEYGWHSEADKNAFLIMTPKGSAIVTRITRGYRAGGGYPDQDAFCIGPIAVYMYGSKEPEPPPIVHLHHQPYFDYGPHR